MLPKNSLARQKLRGKLKVYAGAEHPHAAQQPKPYRRHAVQGERMTATPEFRWQAVGRRKTSVARVYLTPGTGKWDINGRTLGDYFPRPSLVQHIQQSFTATDTLGAFDVKAHVDGGGQSGQAGALRLAIARALVDGRWPAPDQAADRRAADPRSARGRAEEAGPRRAPGSGSSSASGRRVDRWRRAAIARRPTSRRSPPTHVAGSPPGCPSGSGDGR